MTGLNGQQLQSLTQVQLSQEQLIAPAKELSHHQTVVHSVYGDRAELNGQQLQLLNQV